MTNQAVNDHAVNHFNDFANDGNDSQSNHSSNNGSPTNYPVNSRTALTNNIANQFDNWLLDNTNPVHRHSHLEPWNDTDFDLLYT